MAILSLVEHDWLK